MKITTKFLRRSLLIGLLAVGQFSFGQYYYLTGSGNTPGGLNQDDAYPVGSGQPAGWTSILGPSVASPTWSASQSIPFAFSFNGAPVTSFMVASSGVLTFTASPGAAPSTTNAALPSASIPDNSVCVWGLDPSGSNDNVSTKTFGSAPNRQQWIHWSSCTNGGIAWSYYSIVLEESTNNIYIVDQRNTTGTGSLTIGIQVNAATAYSVTGSPNIDAIAGSDPTSVDDYYWEFIQGVQPAVEPELVSFDLLPYVGVGNNNLMGTIKNNGANAITAIDVTWNDGSGPNVDNLTGLNIASGTSYQFTHGTPLNAVVGPAYNITMSISLAGDANTTNNSLSASTVTLTSVPDRTVVGEEKTGTWCGWCPRGAVALAGMESESQFIGIAVHNGDPMTIASYDGSIGTYVPGGYPGGGVDRVLDGDPSSFQTMFNNRVNDLTPCSVNTITANYNSGSDVITVSTDVEFFGNIDGNYRLSLVITEDDVINSGSGWSQVNYYDGGGSGTLTDPNTSFEWSTAGSPVNPVDFGGYDHVARHLSNDNILGDAGSLPATTVPAGVHSYTFANVPGASFDNYQKCHAVVMVVNASTGEVMNAGSAQVGVAGIEELDNAFEYNVFPNPSNGNVNAEFVLNSTSEVSCNIVTTTGQVVFNSGTVTMNAGKQGFNYNGANLCEGVYFVNLMVGDEVVTKRLTIVK